MTRDPLPGATRIPSIVLEDVRLTLASAAGAVNILNGVSLAVEPGEAVALLGPSGSGKSSLLMVAAGLEAPTAGRVSVAGRSLTGLSEDALARFRRQHVGIVFQSFHLVPTMTALENVAVPLELLRRSDAFPRAEAALDSVGLAHRLDHYPGQLSGGEQQRVALARAMVHEPEVLFADEPTGNLDGATGAAIIELLFSLRERARATLFLVTHEEALATRCDRILRMKDGLIVAEERTK
ncbi:MAG TPA: ABC transporter ATP-binding protein [Micropepsaceae bacterium]|nr:ABC transporter ATP-binding protein [Micropepsaceae bacterium]